MSQPKYNLYIIIFLSLFPLMLLAVLVQKHYAFNGRQYSKYDFNRPNPVIGELFPNTRLGKLIKKEGKSFQTVKTDPIYFPLKLTTSFNQVKLKINFFKDSPTVFYIGPQVRAGFAYDLQPIRNAFLDKLYEDEKNWNFVQQDDVVLFQRDSSPKQYHTIKDFLSQIPAAKELASFNYSLNYKFTLPEYQSGQMFKKYTNPIRGEYNILLYLQDEPLKFYFTTQDINRHQGSDPVKILLKKDNRVIYVFDIPDDGFSLATDPASSAQITKLFLPNPGNGVFELQFQSNEDIVTTQIQTTATKWVFKNKIYLVGNNEYSDGLTNLNIEPTELYANGAVYSLRTTHAGGLQKLVIGKKSLDITRTHHLYSFKSDQTITKFFSPRNDLLIQTDGVLAWQVNLFFDPRVRQLDHNSKGIDEKTNYIIAKYSPLQKDGDILSRIISFELKSLYSKDRQIKWLISSPGLEENNSKLYLESLETELLTEPVGFDKLKIMIKNILL